MKTNFRRPHHNMILSESVPRVVLAVAYYIIEIRRLESFKQSHKRRLTVDWHINVGEFSFIVLYLF